MALSYADNLPLSHHHWSGLRAVRLLSLPPLPLDGLAAVPPLDGPHGDRLGGLTGGGAIVNVRHEVESAGLRWHDVINQDITDLTTSRECFHASLGCFQLT